MSSGQKPRDPLHFPKMKVRGGRRRLRRDLAPLFEVTIDMEAINKSLEVFITAFREVAGGMSQEEFKRAFLLPFPEDYKKEVPNESSEAINPK